MSRRAPCVCGPRRPWLVVRGWWWVLENEEEKSTRWGKVARSRERSRTSFGLRASWRLCPGPSGDADGAWTPRCREDVKVCVRDRVVGLCAQKRHLAFLAPLVGPRLARLGVGDVSRRVGVGLGLLLLGRCYRTFTCNGFCSSWGSSARRDALPLDLLALELTRSPRRRLVGSVA